MGSSIAAPSPKVDPQVDATSRPVVFIYLYFSSHLTLISWTFLPPANRKPIGREAFPLRPLLLLFRLNIEFRGKILFNIVQLENEYCVIRGSSFSDESKGRRSPSLTNKQPLDLAVVNRV